MIPTTVSQGRSHAGRECISHYLPNAGVSIQVKIAQEAQRSPKLWISDATEADTTNSPLTQSKQISTNTARPLCYADDSQEHLFLECEYIDAEERRRIMDEDIRALYQKLCAQHADTPALKVLAKVPVRLLALYAKLN